MKSEIEAVSTDNLKLLVDELRIKIEQRLLKHEEWVSSTLDLIREIEEEIVKRINR